MDEHDKSGRKDSNDIYSNVVRAGKRTYFFDVRATKNEDYYLTITESKRTYNEDGSFIYKKHKIFLYKEDFQKFSDALKDTFLKVIELNNEKNESLGTNVENQFLDVNFEDLGMSESNDKETE